MADQQDKLMRQAKHAYRHDQYDDAMAFLLRLIEMGFDMDDDAKDLFDSVAKTLLASRPQKLTVLTKRLAYRSTEPEADTEAERQDQRRLTESARDEAKQFIAETLALIDRYLNLKARGPQEKSDCSSLKANCYLKQAEITISIEEQIGFRGDARDAFREALAFSKEANLPTAHRHLDLVITASVAFFHVFGMPYDALKIATTGLNQATDRVEELDEELFGKIAPLLHRLVEYINVWSATIESTGALPPNNSPTEPIQPARIPRRLNEFRKKPELPNAQPEINRPWRAKFMKKLIQARRNLQKGRVTSGQFHITIVVREKNTFVGLVTFWFIWVHIR